MLWGKFLHYLSTEKDGIEATQVLILYFDCIRLTRQKQVILERMFWYLLIKVARSINVPQDALSTLLFSFASLGLRLREPAKLTGPMESGYPQGHRMHETGRRLGAG